LDIDAIKTHHDFTGKDCPNNILKNKTFTTENELSKKIAKELKKFGFKFIGSVTIFSYLQAIGIYNDHEKDCFLNENKKMK
ncbi:MAG: DNA-3-methyladenine glycosylase I, partial [Malacoplasma sp.]|nr:DNA-3-methyladenine glycosylase I [Malacoplasma sp.]